MDSNQARQQQSGSLGAISHLSALKLTAGSNPNPALGSNPLTNSGRNMQSLPPSGKLQSRSDSNSHQFVSPQGSGAATFQADISDENLRAGPQLNSRGGKLGQSEQLAQPLHHSRPLHVNTMPTRSTGGQATQANEVPTSTQKKQQRKFKDNDSSPGLPFRPSTKNQDNLRQTQKIFSNQSHQGSVKGRATQVKASTLSGGPSAHISDMHKKSGSPSKAAKVAHLTYHQSLPIAGSAQNPMSHGIEQGIKMAAVANKKNSSRNSTILTQASIGKSTGGVGQQRTEAGQDGSNYPNNNINSIVMQTSPAKFFQGTHSNLNSSKKTSGMGLQRFHNQPPPQPEQTSANQLSNQNGIGSLRQSSNSKQLPSEKSASAIHYAVQQQSSQQHFTLFQPNQQQQLYGGQPHQPKNSSTAKESSSAENRPDSLNKVQSQSTLTSVPYSSAQIQQKHYSQVLVNSAQPSAKPTGVPAKTEKTNSMSALQHSQLSQLIHPDGRGANNVYGNFAGDKSAKSKAGGTVSKSSSGLTLNLNNNNRNSTSPISKLVSATSINDSSIDNTPQTGTFQQLNSSSVSSTKNSTVNTRKNFLSSNRLSGQGLSTTSKFAKAPNNQVKPRGAGASNQHTNYQSFQSALNSSGKKKQATPGASSSTNGTPVGAYPKLQSVLLWRIKRDSSPKHDSATKQEAVKSRLKSNKSNLSLIQPLSNQLMVAAPLSQTQTGAKNDRSVSKRKFNWISPRNSNSSAAVQRSYQNLPREEATILNESSLVTDDIRNVKLDLPNQNVVKADSERARFITKEHQGAMQSLLTYFCKSETLAYKQGMNDVIAPFLWLSVQRHAKGQQLSQKRGKSQKTRDVSSKKKKSGTNSGHLQTSVDSVSSKVDLEEPFEMMREFVATFQINLFVDNDFIALQSCLALLKLLLTYHDPAVFKHLEVNCVIPEMYSIPWFITYFASRMASAELVLEFWERLMQTKEGRGDPQFIFFFAVALIVHNRESLFRCDQADLPQKMTQLTIESKQELSQVIRLAEQIEENTPFSFRQLHEMKSLSVKQSPEGLKAICTRLEQLTCVPLMPAELFFYAFPGEIDCPDPACVNSLTWRKDRLGEVAPLAPVTATHQQKQLHHLSSTSQTRSMIPMKASDSEELGEQSVISSLGGSTNNSIVNMGQATRMSSGVAGVSKSGGGHPLETESNLNYEQDHQESPIDLINETARMKHLNSEKDPDSLASRYNRSTVHYSEELRSNADLNSYVGSISVEPLDEDPYVRNLRGKNAPLAEPCARCVQRLHVMQKMEEKGDDQLKNPQQVSAELGGGRESNNQPMSRQDDSFEDLSTDILYSKFRFITVDCRLNTLQQEVTLPYCLKFEVMAASRAEQLKNQIKSLLDYKDSYHICLLGLDQSEDVKDKLNQQSPLEKTDKISIRQFHEYVQRFLVSELINLGFKYISCLPAGFQQVHDLASIYGFQLMDHKDLHQKEQPLAVEQDGNIDTPITVSLTSNCYHCLAQKNRRRNLDNQMSMVAKKYGSMVNTLENSSFGPQSAAGIHLQMSKEKSVPDDPTGRDTMGIDENFNDSTLLQEPTTYQGEKFDLIGFSEYFPFGLKQVYAAANTQLNKILGAPEEEEEAKASKPVSSPRRGGGTKHTVHSSQGQAFEEARVNSASNRVPQRGLVRIGGEISRSRYRQININPAAIPRQQSTESAYIGTKGQMLSTGPLNAGMARSAGKSSGSTCRKTATYQNQQHLQLQSKYKLMSKVPDFKSQFLGSKDPSAVSHTNEIFDDQQLSIGEAIAPSRYSQVVDNNRDRSGHHQQANSEVHRLSSPVRRNRPRINNEVQSQDKDIAQMLQKMQKQSIYSQSDPSVLEENVPFKNVNKIKMPETPTAEDSDATVKQIVTTGNGATSSLDKSNIASTYLGSQVSDNQDANLPYYPPLLESYLLNGIVKQVNLGRAEYSQLLSLYASGHLFTATRLSARKKKFQLRSQLSFNHPVLSQILITPFTVAIIQKTDEHAIAVQNGSRNLPQGEATNSFAVLQSRFFMYDLIKITSRKSTTKIITFYYRIPKKEEYDETLLEEPDMLWNLNKKPPVHYQFAFKRNEFEEVSMSFEFEREEDAKDCINSVSSLYKQLKDQQKKGSRRTTTSTTHQSSKPSSTSQQQVSRNSQPTERRSVKESGKT